MILDASRSLLLVVDIQERLLPAMEAGPRVVAAAAKLLNGAARLGVPVLVSEQYPKGIGNTVPELAALAPVGSVYEKMSFSCAATPSIADAVAASGRTQIVLCGIEAHVCVLQTALGFAATGLGVAVAWDATSARRESDRALAADRLRQAGVVLASTEMVLFEWLGRAGTSEFKDMLALIK
jgi:nicotinamidase-related amidase